MMNRFLEYLGRVWEWTRGLYRVLSLIRFNIVLGIICSFALYTSQGQDVLRALVEVDGWYLNGIPTFCFLLFSASFGWTAWYSAKVMFLFRFPIEMEQKASFQRVSLEAIKRHVTRGLGPVIMFMVSGSLIKAALSYDSISEITSLQLLGMAVICFGSGVLVLYIVYFRGERLNVNKWDKPENQGLTSFKDLPKVPRRWFFVASSASLIALILFAHNSGIIGPLIGTAGILMLWATTLVSIGGALVYIGNQYRVPIIGVIVALAVLFSSFNDNHRVRQITDMRPYQIQQSEWFEYPKAIFNKLAAWTEVRTRAISPSHEPFEDYFEKWFTNLEKEWKRYQLHDENETVPIILISTEGGGIRAAYWTAAILTELQDQSEQLVQENEIPCHFARHVFSISGVFGGSLGAAVFAGLIKEASLKKEQQKREKPGSTCGVLSPKPEYRKVARSILQQDFLSPTVGVMLFPDMLQRFLPFGILDDRAMALEHAWERAWQHVTGSQRFSEPFDDLWNDEHFDVPLLFLNSTVVETGQRIIMQPLPFASPAQESEGGTESGVLERRTFQDYFNNALDGTTVIGAKIPVSTAIHMSARFTYVSPAGTIFRQDLTRKASSNEPLDPEVIRVVDGGYFENSGAVTTDEILLAIERIAIEKGLHLHPIVIHISNEPLKSESRQTEEFPGAYAFLPEVLSPIWALLNVRPARGYQAREELGERAELGLSIPNKSKVFGGSFIHFQLCEYERRLPLGWVLSKLTRDDMDGQLFGGKGQASNKENQAAPFNENNVKTVLNELTGNFGKMVKTRKSLRNYQRDCKGNSQKS